MAERITRVQEQQMARMLRHRAATYDDLSLAMGMCKPRVARWVKALRTCIYIADWAPDKNGRLFVPVFRWGTLPDVPRPGRFLTAAEQMRKTRAGRKMAAVLGAEVE